MILLAVQSAQTQILELIVEDNSGKFRTQVLVGFCEHSNELQGSSNA